MNEAERLIISTSETNFSQRKLGVNLNLLAEHTSGREELGSTSEIQTTLETLRGEF